MVTIGTGSSRTRFIKTDYPYEDGLEAGTTSQTGHKESLEFSKSNVLSKDREGI
jgi:hypothetical protein